MNRNLLNLIISCFKFHLINTSDEALYIHSDFLHDILTRESDLDSPPDCFLKSEREEDDNNNTSVDEEDDARGNKVDHDLQSHRVSSASSSSTDSMFSSSLSSSMSVVSTLSGSSGVESDIGEETGHEDTEEGQDSRPEPRKKPKKKSKSLKQFSLLFRTSSSPSRCRRAKSMGFNGDFNKAFERASSSSPLTASDPLIPQKHMCIRRRPILSSNEADAAEVVTLVRVVVLGGDKEAGGLARAYRDLQQKENTCPRLTKICKLQFYFVPTKRGTTGHSRGRTPNDGQLGSSTKASGSEVRTSVTLARSYYDSNQTESAI